METHQQPQEKLYTKKDLRLCATLAWIERIKRSSIPEHKDERTFEQWFEEEIIQKFD